MLPAPLVNGVEAVAVGQHGHGPTGLKLVGQAKALTVGLRGSALVPRLSPAWTFTIGHSFLQVLMLVSWLQESKGQVVPIRRPSESSAAFRHPDRGCITVCRRYVQVEDSTGPDELILKFKLLTRPSGRDPGSGEERYSLTVRGPLGRVQVDFFSRRQTFTEGRGYRLRVGALRQVLDEPPGVVRALAAGEQDSAPVGRLYREVVEFPVVSEALRVGAVQVDSGNLVSEAPPVGRRTGRVLARSVDDALDVRG